MKKFFDKANFVTSEFDQNQRKQSICLRVLIVLVFILSAFTFLNAFYGFVDCIGSIVSSSIDVAIRDLLRNLPLILCFFMSFWLLLMLHATYRRVNDEKWHRSLMKNSITIIAFTGVNILYILIGLIDGTYASIVEGSPSYLYPLDAMLFSIVILAVGIFALIYARKLKEKLPYTAPKHGEIVTKARGAYCTFLTFFVLFGLFGLSAGIYSIFIYDFMHEHVFFGIAVILAYLISPIMLCVWELYYNKLKEEKKKELLLPLAVLSLCASLLTVILYMVSLSLNKDAPSNAGFGMFPVAFAANVNIATLLQVFAPLIFSIVALIKGILLRKKQD